jgi:hypothetical protein
MTRGSSASRPSRNRANRRKHRHTTLPLRRPIRGALSGSVSLHRTMFRRPPRGFLLPPSIPARSRASWSRPTPSCRTSVKLEALYLRRHRGQFWQPAGRCTDGRVRLFTALRTHLDHRGRGAQARLERLKRVHRHGAVQCRRARGIGEPRRERGERNRCLRTGSIGDVNPIAPVTLGPIQSQISGFDQLLHVAGRLRHLHDAAYADRQPLTG